MPERRLKQVGTVGPIPKGYLPNRFAGKVVTVTTAKLRGMREPRPAVQYLLMTKAMFRLMTEGAPSRIIGREHLFQ